MIDAQYPATVHVTGDVLYLSPGESVSIPRDALPGRVEVSIRCTRCGMASRAAADLKFVYCDDDHFAGTELGFEGVAERACFECEAPLRGALAFNVQRHADGSTELTWDRVDGVKQVYEARDRTILTGAAARAYTESLDREVKMKSASALAAAKSAAKLRGKEPFDLATLETMCDTTNPARLGGQPLPWEARVAEYERMYYIDHPEVMTLADFANIVAEWNRW